MTDKTQIVAEDLAAKSLLVKLAQTYEIDPTKIKDVLKNTAFRQTGRDRREITDEQMAALAIVSNQYGLNPFTAEIYAFPAKNGAIVPMVGLNGWTRMINQHPEFDGMEFVDIGRINTREQAKKKDPFDKSKDPDMETVTRDCPDGISCTIHRRDRNHSTSVTEWYDECYRATDPWREMPRRMLRHKAMVQCARLAFSFVGVYDEDEGERIIEAESVIVETASGDHSGGTAAAVNDALKVGDQTEDIEDAAIVEDEEESDAAAPDDGYTGENGTIELLSMVESSKTAEQLDVVRSLNQQRKASPPDKSKVTQALTARFKVISEGE